MPRYPTPHNTQRNQRIKHPPLFSGKLQYQSSFYKPKTYKDMEEKTLFALRAPEIGEATIHCGTASKNIRVTQKPAELEPSKETFTLSGLPVDKGYYLFGPGARPQNTTTGMYIQGISAVGAITMNIPFYANDSQPGQRIECTTGNKVSVYTKSDIWILEGSFIVPSAGGTVSI